ncbi:MAG: dihydroorotate dehydrogenase electron transfer subunit [Syntrophales bacterium LBB04]|nr:dihydroorotate dehydrogenase electron transfer subunit [Syntrophales bacterium LBB04]
MTNNPALMEGIVIMNREVAQGQFLMALQLPASFPVPSPGQFVMVKATDLSLLLGRPFSVYAFREVENQGVLEIIYRIAGQGTQALSTLLAGASIRVMGPLGNGFDIPEKRNIILLAGGMGLAPLSFLAEHYFDRQEKAAGDGHPRQIIFYMGARTADALVGVERIEGYCDEVKISTDDGSLGYHGTVNELLRHDLASYSQQDTAVFACGPTPMLKGLGSVFQGSDVYCQVSMEERMACGLGACLGCALPVAVRGGQFAYKRVCKDGPVFNIRDVAWTCHE